MLLLLALHSGVLLQQAVGTRKGAGMTCNAFGECAPTVHRLVANFGAQAETISPPFWWKQDLQFPVNPPHDAADGRNLQATIAC